MGRAPANVAGVVRREFVVVLPEPVEQHLLDLAGHLGLLGVVEVTLAELDEDPHVRGVDVPSVELPVCDLDAGFRCVGFHLEGLHVGEEELWQRVREVAGDLLGAQVDPGGFFGGVVVGLGGDLNEGHRATPLCRNGRGECPRSLNL